MNEINKDQCVVRVVDSSDNYEYVVGSQSCLKNLKTVYANENSMKEIEKVLPSFVKKLLFIDVNSIIIKSKEEAFIVPRSQMFQKNFEHI